MIKTLDTRYITDKGNGTYRIRFRVKDEWWSKQISNSTIEDAIALRNEKLAEFENKGQISSDMKVKDCVELWMEMSVKIENAGTTIDDKISKMNNHFLPYFGNKKMSEIDHMSIQKWIKKLMDKNSLRHTKAGGTAKLSPTTIHNVYNVVRAFFTWASSEDAGNIIARTPCKNIKLPEMETYEKEILETDEIETAIKFISQLNSQNQCAFLIPLFSGLRRGEILGLRWKDIDFENKQIIILKSFSKSKSQGMKNKKTKNGKMRIVSMNDLVMNCLKEWQKEQNAQRLACGKKYNTTDKIFTDEFGDQITPDAISNRWRRFCRKNLNKHVTLHGLRASFASLLSYNNVPLKDIQELLGHSDIRVTTKHYTLKYDDLNNRVYDVTNKFNK